MSHKQDFIEWFTAFQVSDNIILDRMFQTTENSPYHQESSVYQHTCMVVEEYINLVDSQKREWSYTDVLGGMACVFHDFGKPMAENQYFNEKLGKTIRSYRGHEEMSVGYWIDHWCCNRGNVKSIVPKTSDMYNVAVMIGYHLPYQLKNDKYRNLKTHLDHNGLVDTFCNILMADTKGRIQDDREASIANNSSWITGFRDSDKSVVRDKVDCSRDVALLVGVSGSGKSKFTTKLTDATIYSYDSLREELVPNEETYESMFRKFNALEINDENMKGVKNGSDYFQYALRNLIANDEVNYLVVDNTNLSRKGRRSILTNLSNDYFRTAVVFISSFEDKWHNNALRAPYKDLNRDILKKQYFGFFPPLLGEVDSLSFVVHGKY